MKNITSWGNYPKQEHSSVFALSNDIFSDIIINHQELIDNNRDKINDITLLNECDKTKLYYKIKNDISEIINLNVNQ